MILLIVIIMINFSNDIDILVKTAMVMVTIIKNGVPYSKGWGAVTKQLKHGLPYRKGAYGEQ